MLERFSYLRAAIDRMTALESKLKPYALIETEWTTVTQLCRILHIFLQATHDLSGKKYPTLALQLPYYEMLLRDIKNAKDRESTSRDKSLFNACSDSWKLLNNYWNKTDHQSAPAIAILLDPRCKTGALRQLGWSQAYINIARNNLERIYTAKYSPQSTLNENEYLTSRESSVPIC